MGLGERRLMRHLLLGVLCFSLMGCELSRYKNETYRQCETNPNVDGAAIGVLAAVPIAVASASTSIGLATGLFAGGYYYFAHDTMCN